MVTHAKRMDVPVASILVVVQIPATLASPRIHIGLHAPLLAKLGRKILSIPWFGIARSSSQERLVILTCTGLVLPLAWTSAEI